MKHPIHSSQRSSFDRALPDRARPRSGNAVTHAPRLRIGGAGDGVMLHSAATEAQSLPWMNTALPPEQRAALLVGAMTLAQKEQQLVGNRARNRSRAAAVHGRTACARNYVAGHPDAAHHQRPGRHRSERLRRPASLIGGIRRIRVYTILRRPRRPRCLQRPPWRRPSTPLSPSHSAT